MAKKKDRGTLFNGAYLGLDPSTFALANYHCSSCNTGFSSNKGIVMLCPVCGATAKQQKGKVEASAIEAFKITSCPTCSSELHSNLEPDEVVAGEFFCPECGDKIALADDMMDEDETLDEGTEDVEVVDDLDDLDEADEELEDEGEIVSMDDEDESEDESEEDEEDESDSSESDESNEDEEAEGIAADIEKLLSMPLSDREALAMDVWHTGKDTIRNVIVAGTPVAQIRLSDQENPAKLQDVFAEEMYEEALAEAMIAKPIGEVLSESNARIFKKIGEKNIVSRTAEVEASLNEKLNAFRKSFKETFLVVLAGTNKNLFPDVVNSLKNGLWEAMAAEGVEAPEAIIEPAFEQNADEFVDQVFDKTMDLLSKSEEVRQEILQMVQDSGVQKVSSSVDPEMARQLEEGSMPFAIGRAGSDIRDNLRGRLQLRRKQ